MLLNEAITLIFQDRGGLREKAATSKGYERECRSLCRSLHNPSIINVTIDNIEQYMKESVDYGVVSHNSLQMMGAAFRKLFNGLRRRGHISLDPQLIPLPRRDFKESRVATDEQIAKVLEIIARSPQKHGRFRNKSILLLLRDTGMRVGELQGLDLKDMDLENKRAVIQTKKSRGMRPQRAVYWYEECNEALEDWMKERTAFLKKRGAKCDALFIANHRDNGVARIGSTAVHIAFRKASWIAGVKPLNPHSLRHRKGHMLAKGGANNSIISGVLGHSSLASSFVYTNLNDTELESVAREYGKE